MIENVVLEAAHGPCELWAEPWDVTTVREAPTGLPPGPEGEQGRMLSTTAVDGPMGGLSSLTFFLTRGRTRSWWRGRGALQHLLSPLRPVSPGMAWRADLKDFQNASVLAPPSGPSLPSPPPLKDCQPQGSKGSGPCPVVTLTLYGHGLVFAV